MAWVIRPAASQELAEAAVHYRIEAGLALALAFTQAVQLAMNQLEREPRLGTPAPFESASRRGLRCWPLRRFPYTLIYRHQGELPTLLAVAHQRRAPAYWRGRR